MNCALCCKDRVLRQSHIIPEFLYLSLYDEKHRFEQVSADPNERNKILQKGLREGLLCDECEGLFAKWERYASMVLRGGTLVTVERNGDWLLLSGLDYAAFKLFQMSVLWRAGISSLTPFAQVKLGPHQERLRAMLLAADPGPPEQYGCLMFMVMHEDKLLQGLLVPPTWARLLGHKGYRFVFGGLAFLYLVTSRSIEHFVREHFIQPSGIATVKLQQAQEMSYLVKSVSEIAGMGKLDEPA